jgi:hypothetical protein
LVCELLYQLFSLIITLFGFFLAFESQIDIVNPLETFAKKVFYHIPIYLKIFEHSLDFCKFNFASKNELHSLGAIKFMFDLIVDDLGNIMPNKVVIAIMLDTWDSVWIALAAELAHVVVTELGCNISTFLVFRVAVQD